MRMDDMLDFINWNDPLTMVGLFLIGVFVLYALIALTRALD